MRYIGGKTDLLTQIGQEIQLRNVRSVMDVFAGSGAVSTYLDQNGYITISNDILYFSYVINRGHLTLNDKPLFENLPIEAPIDYLNSLTLENSGIDLNDCFVWNNYSKHDGCDRMYFQEKNALKIDLIRITIESWKNNNLIDDDEYYYLLSRLIHAIPFVSNITGVYGAYLKQWDPRSYKDLILLDNNVMSINGHLNTVTNLDYTEALSSTEVDLVYADPPYNSRQYLPNYHILETIARYDNPTIHGKTGIRDYFDKDKSEFCSKTKVKRAFKNLIENARTNYMVISYNTEGLIGQDELTSICLEYARPSTFRLICLPYRRYKSHNDTKKDVNELIYSFQIL